MKRFTLSVAVTAVMGLAAFTLAGAQAAGQAAQTGQTEKQAAGQDAQVKRRGPGRGFGMFGPGPGGPGGRGPMMVLRGVDLTDQQKEEIRTILQAEAAPRQGPPAEAELQRQLQAELYADTPDLQKIDTLQQQLAQAEAARLAKRIEIEQKVAAVLTPEQRAEVRQKLANGPQGRERRRPGR